MEYLSGSFWWALSRLLELLFVYQCHRGLRWLTQEVHLALELVCHIVMKRTFLASISSACHTRSWVEHTFQRSLPRPRRLFHYYFPVGLKSRYEAFRSVEILEETILVVAQKHHTFVYVAGELLICLCCHENLWANVSPGCELPCIQRIGTSRLKVSTNGFLGGFWGWHAVSRQILLVKGTCDECKSKWTGRKGNKMKASLPLSSQTSSKIGMALLTL